MNSPERPIEPRAEAVALAYNAGKSPISVRFSDGQLLQVQPGQLARSP